MDSIYLWIKALHIMAVIAWMAGLFYLPRLFVHHVERAMSKPDMVDIFLMMERKLLKIIMNPAMMVAWGCGVVLAVTPGIVDWGSVWPWAKLVGIVLMTGFHIWLSRQLKLFEAGRNKRSGRFFRMMNEVPTVLMIVIVMSVIVRPV